MRASQGRMMLRITAAQCHRRTAAEARKKVAMERFAMVQGRQEAEMRHRLDRAAELTAELTAEPEQTATRQG